MPNERRTRYAHRSPAALSIPLLVAIGCVLPEAMRDTGGTGGQATTGVTTSTDATTGNTTGTTTGSTTGSGGGGAGGGGPGAQFSLALGSQHACAIKAGKMKCWGADSFGQAVPGTMDMSQSPPTALADIDFGQGVPLQAAGGFKHTCAIVDVAGTRELRCFGGEDYVEFGGAMLMTNGTNVGFLDQIAAGAQFTCVSDGKDVHCFGHNDLRQCGPAASSQVNAGSTTVPFTVSSADHAVIVQAGTHFACAILTNPQQTNVREVHCWGANEVGQVDPSNLSPAAAPHHIVLAENIADTVRPLAVGATHVCVIVASGDVRCWGGNGSQQVAAGSSMSAGITNMQFDGGNSTASAIAAGKFNTCVVLTKPNMENALRCWGSGMSGLLGDGHPGDAAPPDAVTVDLPSGFIPVDVLARESFICAVSKAGEALCWGENTLGQLGQPNFPSLVNATPIDLGW